mmetsp:Transcript_57312/g.167744  ORF Transcript_57312/g.167744 Transcript_57312/m.167744 type:complete len:685 (+) Transcript_57312:89-2143(+)
MVHLVSERPRAALLPVLIERCRSATQEGYIRPKSRQPWWKAAFPVYYELLYLSCNALFFVGSVLFLPIFEDREISVSFSMTVLNVDKDELLRANRTFLDAFEGGILSAVAQEAGPQIQPEHAHLVWHATKSCKLNQAIILDSTIFPPQAVDPSDVKEQLGSSPSLAPAVNRSISMLGEIQSITTGPISVQMLNKPIINENATPGKWAIDLGCDFFILGSFVMAVLSIYDVFEDFLACCLRRRRHHEASSPRQSTTARSSQRNEGSTSISRGTTLSNMLLDSDSPTGARPKQDIPHNAKVNAAEKALYFAGSFVFLIGTFYFQHPKKVASSVPSIEEADVLNMAIAMFIVGSAIFAFAAFVNALSLASAHTTFGTWAVAVCGIYECGGILFVMGSVCFMPNQGCGKGMEVMGAWSFIVGSGCYLLGGCIETAKTVALLFLKQKQEEAALKIAQAYSSMLTRRRFSSTIDLAIQSHRASGGLPRQVPAEPGQDDSEFSSLSDWSEAEDSEEAERRESLGEGRPAEEQPDGRGAEQAAQPTQSCGEQGVEAEESGQSWQQQKRGEQEPPWPEEEEDQRRSSSRSHTRALRHRKDHPQRAGRAFSDGFDQMGRKERREEGRGRSATEEVAGPGLWSTFFAAMAAERLRRRASRLSSPPLEPQQLPSNPAADGSARCSGAEHFALLPPL